MNDVEDLGGVRGLVGKVNVGADGDFEMVADFLEDLQTGFDAGAADGLMGERTRAAITTFQNAVGLTVDGEPTLGLLAVLREGAADTR